MMQYENRDYLPGLSKKRCVHVAVWCCKVLLWRVCVSINIAVPQT